LPKRRVTRPRLSRERILDAAIELADREGLGVVTMRRLGQHLGVEAMSLYKHVADKDDVVAGIGDRVAAEFVLPSRDVDWRTALRTSSIAAHEVLLRHPWAGPVLESLKVPSEARLAYLDAVIGVLRDAGFSMSDVAHAFGALDSHLYGFTMQITNWPFGPDEMAEAASAMAELLPAGRYPNLDAMAETAVADGSDLLDFTFGLDLLLDGLERRLAAAAVETGEATR
jgi:AcrR family transcriptional regulator